MKLTSISSLILLSFLMNFAAAQSIVNNGADIIITLGSSLVIDGDYRNELDGSMDNNGSVLVSGDWTNNANSGSLLQGTLGTVTFNGSSVQSITGTAITYFSNLDLQNNASLGNTIVVSSSLQLAGTYLTLGNAALIMQYAAPIMGANSTGYIITNGSGILRQLVNASDRVFPIGTISAFTPITINNVGSADYYSVSVFPDVRTNGLTGGTIPEINDCVNMTWAISESVAGGSDLTVTPFWGTGIEGSNFDRDHCGVGYYSDGSWDGQPEGSALGADPYSISRSDITTPTALTVGDLESPMAIPLDIRLESYAFLEGPFNGADMYTNLNDDGVVPLLQPYSGYPWYYTGSESVISVPANTVDWVLLELRDAINAASATGATAFARKAAFLLNDGTIVDLDGFSIPTFNGVLTNSLFVVVYHRNHLPIMSANAVIQLGGVYTYNFTTAVGQVYGGVAGHKQITPGNWGMMSGNADGDKFVIINDLDNVWGPQSGTYGYKAGDLNLDTEVDNVDKNDHWNENTDQISQVPN